MFDINTNPGYFLHLIKCALKNEQPCEKTNNVSFEIIYDLARRHGLVNLVWFSIQKLNNMPDIELFEKWNESSAQLLVQMAYQEMELEKLIQVLAQHEYKMLPLKGYQIKQYYPEPDMRTMGDIDLLVQNDGTQHARDNIKEIMLHNGYAIEILNDGQVDSYKKSNNITMEIHFEFMYKSHPHYEDFIVDWSTLNKTEKDYVFEMTIEDLYYYNIGHFIKNMGTRGNGIKPAVDAYVLWNNMNDEQKQKTNQKLEKAQLKTVSDMLLKVSHIWFDSDIDDNTTKNIQEYLLNNAVYGYEKNREIYNVLKEHNDNVTDGVKKKYLSRVFPSANSLYSRYSIKHRSFILLPFLWLARIISLLFMSKSDKLRIKTEIEETHSLTQEDIDFFKTVYNDFEIEY